MKKDSKSSKKKDGIDIDFTNCKQIMTSNLPLLFANGQPRSLETISQPELEEFVPFMVRCSVAEEILKKPKEIRRCTAPEWWPLGFPFIFPPIEQSDWIDRHVMLKSLVCRCYTFYNCEFLLKFSSELAEFSPSQLRFEENKEEGTTSIFDVNGCMLVKCRNENLNYDKHKNHRRYLSPAHRSSLNQAKKFEPVIDLTFDTSSEDEKEVYFKETAPPASQKCGKRKASVEQTRERVAKQRCIRRVFNDFAQETPEPPVLSQEQYMQKFQLIPLGKEVPKEVLKVERKRRLASSFTLLSISSQRGQELLLRNKHSFNLENCLERIERYCGPGTQEDSESNQVCTRAAAIFSATFKWDDIEDKMTDEDEHNGEGEKQAKKWCHVYKWPRKTYRPVYPHMGPSVKPCSVLLSKLTEEEIDLLKKVKRSTSTMTPDEWWNSELAICKCQLIPTLCEKPLFNKGLKYKHKKSSTRCTCGRSKSQYLPSPEGKYSLSEVRMEASSEDICKTHAQESVKSQSKASNENDSLHKTGNFNESGSSVSLNTVTNNPGDVSLNHKRTLFRRPLAVVPSTPAAVSCCVTSDTPRQSASFPHPSSPQHIAPKATKANFSRSIMDAIKWYTQDDTVSEPIDGLSEFSNNEEAKTNDPSQENIKPMTELTLPNLVKPIDYFQQNLNVAEYDYCYKRCSDGTPKLVTRRGERHHYIREPCPSCFQGRDNFCVYEFVRQAKIAGLSLPENKKHLQSWYFRFILEVNKRL